MKTPEPNQIWQYEDMANQNTNPVLVLGRVTHTYGNVGNPWRMQHSEYVVRDIITGQERYTDMTQSGWRRLS